MLQVGTYRTVRGELLHYRIDETGRPRFEVERADSPARPAARLASATRGSLCTTSSNATILPLFHRQPLAYAEVMRATIAHNGSFFNAQRMVSQYVDNAYRAGPAEREARGHA